jgi:hypothetical protein
MDIVLVKDDMHICLSTFIKEIIPYMEVQLDYKNDNPYNQSSLYLADKHPFAQTLNEKFQEYLQEKNSQKQPQINLANLPDQKDDITWGVPTSRTEGKIRYLGSSGVVKF